MQILKKMAFYRPGSLVSIPINLKKCMFKKSFHELCEYVRPLLSKKDKTTEMQYLLKNIF
jgi:hypothetical protein